MGQNSRNSSPVLGIVVVLALLLASSSPASSSSSQQQATFVVNAGVRKKPSAGGSSDAASFDQFIAANVENYIINKQIYEKKLKDGNGTGKTVDADLSAAEAGKVRYVVSPDGKGRFRTIAEAVKAVPEKNKKRVILDIMPGTYK